MMALMHLLFASMLPILDTQANVVVGSSVLINHQLVMTAAHVTTGKVLARCMGQDIEANAIAFSSELDLSLLALNKPCNMPVSRLAPENALPGAAVHGVGCPKRHCGWLAFGHVVGYDYTASPAGGVRRVLVSDAPIWMGNSGGPLFNEQNELIGIASQIMRFDGPDGMFRLFAVYVPIDSVWLLLQQVAQDIAI